VKSEWIDGFREEFCYRKASKLSGWGSSELVGINFCGKTL
jgi:hypothetical protein